MPCRGLPPPDRWPSLSVSHSPNKHWWTTSDLPVRPCAGCGWHGHGSRLVELTKKQNDGYAREAKSRAILKSVRNWLCSRGQCAWAVTGGCFQRASLGR